jgi:DNA-binding transcriptional LysR family regulator
MFDFEELQSFLAVADRGGITLGARHLGISKSLVSRRLSRLERELGTQLLRRTTRGATLTEAGQTFRDHSARVIAELEAARQAVSGDGELRGLLRIAAPLSFGTMLSPVIAQMAQSHPKLEMQISFSDAIVDLVGGGHDAAIRISVMPNSTLVVRKIGEVQGRIVASPAYLGRHPPLHSLKDLEQHEVLLQGDGVWPITSNGKARHIRPKGRFQIDNGLAILSAAMAGMGVAMLPDFLVDKPISKGELVRLLQENEPPPSPLQVVRAPGRQAPRKVAALTELLTRHFATQCRAKVDLPAKRQSKSAGE